MKALIPMIVVGGIALFSNRLLSQNIIPKPGCNIKGNISWSNNEKLYHIPGMEDYEITKISRTGERWFCTESEAIASGWKKAPK
ncbi:succinoglycan biosynthesis protein exoi [Chamaesiphon sp.]|uniref:sunset domain-containing protein n=1 Tax=Chamaesiphon sp. TaxID=2814140 RepID=UPI00359386FC